MGFASTFSDSGSRTQRRRGLAARGRIQYDAADAAEMASGSGGQDSAISLLALDVRATSSCQNALVPVSCGTPHPVAYMTPRFVWTNLWADAGRIRGSGDLRRPVCRRPAGRKDGKCEVVRQAQGAARHQFSRRPGLLPRDDRAEGGANDLAGPDPAMGDHGGVPVRCAGTGRTVTQMWASRGHGR